MKDEITRVGKEGSAKYTQLGRRKESRAFKTPGPGRYENHRCHPQGKLLTDSENSYLIIIFQGKFIFQNTQWVAEQNIESAMHIQRQILTPCRN